MCYTNLYRRYKISLITDEGITDTEKEIVEFILDKIKDLTIFADDNFHNYLNSVGECIFQHDNEYVVLWVKFKGFWEYLRIKYSFSDYNIQVIIKDIVENVYSIKVKTTMLTMSRLLDIENVYKKNQFII
jgi:hypothetical protein